MVYEYVLAGVLVSLLGSVFLMIINSTLSEKKKEIAIVSENGVFLAPEIEKSTDVVIVGAGVAGAALAYTLGKQGRCVHVIKRDLIKRDLSKLDRIVGELLQPGGYLKLIQLGLEDCANESIDAQKVFGYALYKDGNDTKLSYPLETYSSNIAGRSFHSGRFIQRMRKRAATLPNVKLEQGTLTTLLEEKGTIKGVMYKNKAGEEMRSYAPLTIVCDGCFSNLRRSISTPNPVSSTINTLASALYKVFCASPDPARQEMRKACFDYLSLGGVCSSGPISLLSGLHPRPISLFLHFFAVAVYGVGRLMIPFPTPKCLWLGARLILSASGIIFPIIKAEGVRQMFFPATMPAYYRVAPVHRKIETSTKHIC